MAPTYLLKGVQVMRGTANELLRTHRPLHSFGVS